MAAILFLRAGFAGRVVLPDSGVVDQDGDGAEGAAHTFVQRRDFLLFGEIRLEGGGDGETFHKVHSLVLRLTKMNGDGRAGFAERLRDAAADSARGAGDQRDLAGEVDVHLTALRHSI